MNKNGKLFLNDIQENGTQQKIKLTQEQVNIILGLQNCIEKKTEGEWKVLYKKKRGGNLNLQKISNKLFIENK